MTSIMMDKDRKSKIDILLKQLSKDHPDSNIGWGSDLSLDLEFIPIGISVIDNFIGGGWPRRRFSVVGGAKGVGKSTLVLRSIANAQRLGNVCVYADLERTFDPKWAQLQGVDTDNLIHLQGKTAEEVLDALMAIYDSKTVDMAVIDSVSALSPKGELETKDGKQRSMEDDTIGLIARKLSQFFRMACSRNATSNCATILVAQVRTDIGSYGGMQKITGGNALEHYNSLTMILRRGARSDAPKAGDRDIGYNMVMKLDKTKLNSNEGQSLDIPFLFGEGISAKLITINHAISLGLIQRSGAWYQDTINDKKYQGMSNLIAEISNDDISKIAGKLLTDKETASE